MANAEIKEVWSLSKDQIFSVITDYQSYPKFVEGCQSAEVKKNEAGKKRVEYHVNVMSQDVVYTLDLEENLESGVIEWKLVDSNFFKRNNGRWELKPRNDHETEVTYALDVEFKIPVPGFILNRLVKGSLPGMVKSFEKQARAAQKKGKP